MKRFNRVKKSITHSLLVTTMCLALALSGSIGSLSVHATEADSSTGYETTETINVDANGILGKNSDVGIEVTESITGEAGKNVKISFKLKSSDAEKIKLKSVYPVIDDSFQFETSGNAYKIVKAGDDAKKQKTLSASFKLKARSDIPTGYHGVKFIGEYQKTEDDGTVNDYYVIKTINIYFTGEDYEEDSDDDDDSDSSDDSYDDEEEEAVAPKLIITGYETEPETIMAGQTFKLTIHVQNTSKSTPVCNGKFLIGNEAGSFLPTNGSSAVYVESIPAGKTGDLVIEMKAGANLDQKNYILVVKGDFDDGKGNNFTSSDNLTVPVYQEVKFNVSEITMTPEVLGIGTEGTLMFTINNTSSVDVNNVKVSVKGDAVTAEESYVGNIAGSSSAYATMYLTGAKDNADTSSITLVMSYEDSEGATGTVEQTINCLVNDEAYLALEEEEFYEDEEYFEDEEYYEDEYEEEGYILGLPFLVWIIIAVVVVVIIIVVIILLVRRKKKRMAELLEEEDGEDEVDNATF